MPPFDTLWLRLRQIQTCQFTSRSHSNPATHWTGAGAGVVSVESPTADTLIFRESGDWQPATVARSLRFRNTYRWTRHDTTIQLEHLRFGDQNPVYLFDLAPAPDGTWTSLTAHLCRQDHYTAQLVLECHRLVLTWTVTGPEKQDEIKYIYSS